jgi:ATP-dependent Clp protease ATP-binding subunit ClpB
MLEEITIIVDLLLADLNKRLVDRRIAVRLDKKAKAWAAEKGYDPSLARGPLSDSFNGKLRPSSLAR